MKKPMAPKPRPNKPAAPMVRPKQPTTRTVIDVSPRAEAGDQFFVKQAMQGRKTEPYSKRKK